jgi:hypothetical protein
VAGGKERFVEVTTLMGGNNNDWNVIKISNSFNGEIKMKNGRLQTTKKDRDWHGVGISTVTEIVESKGGIVNINPDVEKKVFTAMVLMPKNM